MDSDFESKIETVLRLTGACSENQIKTDATSFSCLKNVPSLRGFDKWFVHNINEDNCLSANERREFLELQKQGSILSRKECKEALRNFYVSPPETLISFKNIHLEVVEDDIQDTASRIKKLKKLQEKLLNDIKETDCELQSIDSELEAAEKSCLQASVDCSIANRTFFEKLGDLTTSFSSAQEDFLKIKDQLTVEKSKLESSSTDKSLQSNVTNITMHSFASGQNNLQNQYLMLMNFSRFEQLNESYIEALHALIKREFYKYQHASDEASGDLEKKGNSIANINDITFDINLELKRLNQSLSSAKQKKVLAEVELTAKNKTIARLKELQNDLATKRWKPNLDQMSADNVNQENRIKESEIRVNHCTKVLGEQCQKWSDALLEKTVANLLSNKIATKTILANKVDVLLSSVVNHVACNFLFTTFLEREGLRIRTLAGFISDFWSTIENKIETLRRCNMLLESNFNDYLEFKSHSDLGNSRIALKLADIFNVEPANILNTLQEMFEEVSTKEDMLIQQCSKKVNNLFKMKQFLDEQKHQIMSYLAESSRKSELENAEMKIADVFYELRCARVEISKFKDEINKNPHLREEQKLLVKFLTRKPTAETDVPIKTKN